MCDQDHYDDDLRQYQVRGAVSRRQFGALSLGAAENDDQREPDAKNVLTYAKANLPAVIEVYPAAHGWCPPDSAVYNEVQAEKAWGRMLVLFKKALA